MRQHHTFLAVSLGLLLPLSVVAQISPPSSPTATRPVTLQSPPAPPSPRPAPRPEPRDEQRSVLPAPPRAVPATPIPSKGPAQPTAPATPAPPPRVYDSQGRQMQGMKQVGPNRVMDTRTGRYYDTTPTGDGQRLKP